MEAATQTLSEVTGDLSKIEASTQMESEYIKELEQLRLTVKDLMMRVSPPPFSEETFTTDESVKFYTGLPNVKVLKAIYTHVLQAIAVNGRMKLKPFQEFICVIMKLYLNCPMQDLAYRFKVSVSTISRILFK